MFKVNQKQLLLKLPTIYDFQADIPQEVRKQVIKSLMIKYPGLQIKGGNSLTNPYKIPYELVLAERREQFEKYKNSILWSPRFTPWHFKNAFLYPALVVSVIIWYITYVAIPSRIVYLRQNYGYLCEDLVKRGWVEGWLDEEDQESKTEPLGFDFKNMSFNQISDKVRNNSYADLTMKDLQNLEDKPIYYEQSQVQNDQKHQPNLQITGNRDMINYRHSMQKKLEKIYQVKNQL